MAIENQKLFSDSIAGANDILIALPKNPNIDTLGSSLALSAFLKKLDKHVQILCENSDFENAKFLPGIDQIKNEIAITQNFLIKVNTSSTKLEELSYRQEAEDLVEINLKPKGGNFTPQDISFGQAPSGYDLIVCLDTPSLEHLGNLYSSNAEIFFNTPKINIDNHAANENFGNINVIDITASSTAEVLLELMKGYEAALIDSDIATSLLAGIISSTNSFQHSATTPNSFAHASELISLGADQQGITRYLFKTKRLEMLKLWGRAMARIETLGEPGVVLSLVNAQDIEKSGADEKDMIEAVREMTKSVGDLKLLFFAAECADNGIELLIYGHRNIKLAEIVNYFGGEMVSFSIGKAKLNNRKLPEVKEVLMQVLDELRPRLGL